MFRLFAWLSLLVWLGLTGWCLSSRLPPRPVVAPVPWYLLPCAPRHVPRCLSVGPDRNLYKLSFNVEVSKAVKVCYPSRISQRLVGLVQWDLQIWKIVLRFPALWAAMNAKGHYRQPCL